MIQHAVQSRDAGSRPIPEGLSVFVVLETTFDGVQNPRVIEWVGEDVDTERFENGDGGLDVVFEVEDDEIGLFETVGWRESDEELRF